MDDLTLNETLTGIFDALLQHESTDGDAIIASLGPTLLTCVHDGPEAFHDRLQYPWQNALNAAVRAAYPTVRESNLGALQFCYTHADFLTMHLKRLFEQFEGLFACADKATWVLQQYHHSLTTSTEPAPLPDSREYWHPHHASLAWWFDVCRHAERLYYGDPQAYLRDMAQLVLEQEGTAQAQP